MYVCLFVTVHHFVRVPGGWIYVFRDFYRTNAESAALNYPFIEASVGPFCMGYFIGDLVCFALIEAFRGELEYAVHHVVIISIISASCHFNFLIFVSIAESFEVSMYIA